MIGSFIFSTNFSKPERAFPLMIPEPARIQGRLADFNNVNAVFNLSKSSSLLLVSSLISNKYRSFSSTIACCISKGISNQTGPLLPSKDILIAFKSSLLIERGSVIITAYFVMYFTTGTIWNS